MAQLLFVASFANAQPYQITNTKLIVGDDLSKTVTTIQEGNNPLNRFFMVKVVKQLPGEAKVRTDVAATRQRLSKLRSR